MAGLRKKSDVLAKKFSCASTINEGDVVEISGAGIVALPSAAASLSIVGTVSIHEKDALFCTVDTKFREYREDRVAGEAIDAGSPFVHGAGDGKLYAYDDETMDSAAIAGLAVTTAAADGDVIKTLEY